MTLPSQIKVRKVDTERFRVEVDRKGLRIVCGGILPYETMKVGQRWAGSSGSVINITKLERFSDSSGDMVVHYEGDHQKPNYKFAFAFQCRYCLVLEEGQTLETLFQEYNELITARVSGV